MYMDTHCRYTETYNPEHIYTFTGTCIICKEKKSVEVKGKELFLLRRGNSIQDALSNNEDEREFLVSGACGPCYDKIFTYEEDETEE